MQLFALLFACAVAAQQAYNTITFPGQNVVVQAGGGVQTLSWSNASQGNVRIVLYTGSNPLTPRQTLADSIPNTGTYLWNPATWLPLGSDYVISVEDVSGSAPIQYSRYFTVQLCSTCSASPIPTTLSAPSGQVTPTAVPTLASTVTQAQFAAAASTTGAAASQSAAASSAGASASPSAASGAAGSAAAGGVGNQTTMSRASGSNASATVVSGTRVAPSGSAAASGNTTAASSSAARSAGTTVQAGLAVVFGAVAATLLL